MTLVDDFRHLINVFLFLPVVSVLRYLLPDFFDDVRSGDDLDFDTRPLVTDTPGLFPHAHRLQDISSSEDGRSVSADATRSAAKDLFGAAPAGPADDVLSRDLSDVGLATSTRRADETGTASSTQRQQVYVMRHGERQDMAEAGWAASAERPWDPPLSAFGVSQAAQRGADFAAKRTPVTTVVASPFTRCIQTAAGFMRAYGLPADRLHVDARVCEWMSSRNLGLSHVTPTVRASMHGEAALWFWGAQREAGLQAAIADAWSPTAAQQVTVGPLCFPAVEEGMEAARARFEKAVKVIANEHKGHVLIVTHGDSVGAVVERVQAHCTVYQVDTTGFVTLERLGSGALTITDATGVAWID